jgi:hypothetical protein
MGTFVRLLPRLLFLGVAAAALLVLAERERSAHADALPPVSTPVAPAPPPPTTPQLPTPPPVPVPALLPVPVPPTVPPVPAPAPPGLPVPAPPEFPAAPGVPGAPGVPPVDPVGVTGIVGPLPGVPEVAPPEPLLPDVAPVPEVPAVPVPLDRILELGATPAPDAPAPANAPELAGFALLAGPASSHLDPRTGNVLGGVDVGFSPTRAPPTEVPGTDDASRRAGLLAEAPAYASTSLRDPLLRPD